jgi:plastocyanin
MLRLATIFLTATATAIIAMSLGFGVNSAVAGGGGGHGCVRAPSESEATTVTIRESCFVTTLLRVQPGTTVTFANRDATFHNVFTSDNVALVRESELQPGADAHVFIEQPGLLMYYCTLHPSMVGVIVAGDETAAPALASGATSATGLPVKDDPPVASAKVADDSSSLPVGAIAGIAIAVGLVSAGGGFAIRRRA